MSHTIKFEVGDDHKKKKKKVHVFVLPGLSLAGSSWLWAAQAVQAGPVLVFAAPQMCWWYTASKLWSPTAQTVECGYEWHSEKTQDATLKTAADHISDS